MEDEDEDYIIVDKLSPPPPPKQPPINEMNRITYLLYMGQSQEEKDNFIGMLIKTGLGSITVDHNNKIIYMEKAINTDDSRGRNDTE